MSARVEVELSSKSATAVPFSSGLGRLNLPDSQHGVSGIIGNGSDHVN